MATLEPVDPLENVEHYVSCVRQSSEGERKKLIRELLRGKLDPDRQREIGSRRALLCTRLREEELWPAR